MVVRALLSVVPLGVALLGFYVYGGVGYYSLCLGMVLVVVVYRVVIVDVFWCSLVDIVVG